MATLAQRLSANGNPNLELYPCRGMGYHDFVVGISHAVCNKCQHVLSLLTAKD